MFPASALQRRLLPVFIAWLLSGCVYFDHTDYPQGWVGSDGQLLANGCPDLSGHYHVLPMAVHPAEQVAPLRLDEMLGASGLSDLYRGGRPWPVLPAATAATLRSEGDWLYLQFHDAGGGTADLRFKRKHWWGGVIEGADGMFQCLQLEQTAVLALDGNRRPGFPLPYATLSSDVAAVVLSKGADGALTVSYRTVRVGIEHSGIGSHAGWVGGLWWRYAPLVSQR